MHKLANFLGLLLLALVMQPFGAQAKEPVPVIEHLNIPVTTSSGKPITSDQVRDAIIAAATARKWEVSRSPSQDLLSASLSWYGKHSISVSIPYSPEKFSIKYQNSINMKYDLARAIPESAAAATGFSPVPAGIPAGIPAGTPIIHPRYNEFVQQLLQSIQAELKKF